MQIFNKGKPIIVSIFTKEGVRMKFKETKTNHLTVICCVLKGIEIIYDLNLHIKAVFSVSSVFTLAFIFISPDFDWK